MTKHDPSPAPSPAGSFWQDVRALWRSLPDKALFFGLLAAWLALFHFFGNSTFGLVDTRSLFEWWGWTLRRSPDEEHAYLMPLVMLGLLLWKGRELAAVPKQPWGLALGLVVLALALHVGGYLVQQARVSIIAFALGLYGLTGVMWGRHWLSATLFPFSLLLFSVPLGADIDRLTHPLRLLATQITGAVSHALLGIPVVWRGTQMFSAEGGYQYDVAAACSGIRSLTATFAFAVVFSFLSTRALWRRLLIVASAIPLAVLGNVTRLTLIVVAAEMFGQRGGDYVHASGLFSLAPYVPALVGILLLGHWLDEDRQARRSKPPPAEDPGAPLPVGFPPPKP